MLPTAGFFFPGSNMDDIEYTEREKQVIIAHLTKLRDGASETYLKLKALKNPGNSEQMAGQILYWKHLISGFNWAIRTCQQRKATA